MPFGACTIRNRSRNVAYTPKLAQMRKASVAAMLAWI